MIDDALTLYEWALRTIRKGHMVGEQDQDGHFSRVLSMGMSNARAAYLATVSS